MDANERLWSQAEEWLKASDTRTDVSARDWAKLKAIFAAALLEAEKAALERAEKVAEIHLHTTADGDGEIWIVKRILQDIRALPSTPAKDQEG